MKNENLIALLTKAYSSELETVQNYLANSVWLDGFRSHEVVEALSEDVADELGHAQRLAQRLKHLGACPPGSLSLERNQTVLQPAADPTDLRHVVKGVLIAERDAIATYREIIVACGDDDPVTAHIAVHNLADEERHLCLFEGFLKGMDKAYSA